MLISAKYRFSILILVLLFSSRVVNSQPLAENTAPGCESYLFISGESNVNEFTFTYNGEDAENTDKTNHNNRSVEISIPIRDFEASNPMMYSDFLELMKESRYPRIKVSFSMEHLEKTLKGQDGSCPEVNITIAGVTRTYSIECSVDQCSGNILLKGRQVVKLSDFKLKPPAKLLGLIKVSNEINVNFGFIITFTKESFSAKL